MIYVYLYMLIYFCLIYICLIYNIVIMFGKNTRGHNWNERLDPNELKALPLAVSLGESYIHTVCLYVSIIYIHIYIYIHTYTYIYIQNTHKNVKNI